MGLQSLEIFCHYEQPLPHSMSFDPLETTNTVDRIGTVL